MRWESHNIIPHHWSECPVRKSNTTYRKEASSKRIGAVRLKTNIEQIRRLLYFDGFLQRIMLLAKAHCDAWGGHWLSPGSSNTRQQYYRDLDQGLESSSWLERVCFHLDKQQWSSGRTLRYVVDASLPQTLVKLDSVKCSHCLPALFAVMPMTCFSSFPVLHERMWSSNTFCSLLQRGEPSHILLLIQYS